MISNKPLIDRINLDSLGTGQELADIISAAAAIDVIQNTVYSVPNLAALPDPALNTGRMIFVQDIYDYRYSDGYRWSKKFRSNLEYENILLSWGTGNNGILGTNETQSKSSPVSVVGGFTDWCQVSAGNTNNVAMRQNGTLWSWGGSILGDNTIANRSSPVSVVGGFTDWCQVSAGNAHMAAVRQNGTLWAWGNNSGGRLGDNTTTIRSSPVSVVGGFTDWCQVSAGGCHTAAVRQNGTIWTWGINYCGRLGDGTTVNRSSPVSVVGGFTDWCQVSAGLVHGAAIRQNGTLWTWRLTAKKAPLRYKKLCGFRGC